MYRPYRLSIPVSVGGLRRGTAAAVARSPTRSAALPCPYIALIGDVPRQALYNSPAAEAVPYKLLLLLLLLLSADSTDPPAVPLGGLVGIPPEGGL